MYFEDSKTSDKRPCFKLAFKHISVETHKYSSQHHRVITWHLNFICSIKFVPDLLGRQLPLIIGNHFNILIIASHPPTYGQIFAAKFESNPKNLSILYGNLKR